MPSIQQLRYLVALADTLSFSRAAAISNVTQPTLSMQFKDLERRVGAKLVERNRARVVMTHLGLEVSKKARVILSEIEDIYALTRTQGSGLGGTIRVGVVHTLGAYLLPLVVPEFRARYPELRFYIREELPDMLMNHLDDGRHDILICPTPVLRRDFLSVQLFTEPFLVVLPHDHPLASQQEINRTDLKGETILTMERGHKLSEQVSLLCEDVGASLSYDYEGTSLDTLRQMVAMGMGISLLPALYVRSEVEREKLVVARPLAGVAPDRTIGLVFREGSLRRDSFEKIATTMMEILRRRAPQVSVPNTDS